MFKKNLLAILVIFGISGCVFEAQQVYLNPKVNISEKNIGHNSKIFLKVIDDRDTTTIGHKGSYEGKHAQITSKNSLPVALKQEIVRGLKTYKFKITNNSSNNKKLTVEIRDLEYTTSSGFSSGGVHIKSYIQVIAQNNGRRIEKRYRTEKTKSVQIAPNDTTNEKWINETLTETITKLFQDRELMNLLSK